MAAATALRRPYDGLRRLIGQAAGLLLLAQASSRREIVDLPAVAAARAKPVSNRPRDSELAIMAEIMRRYALLPPDARLRVHRYVSERLDSLPVIAAVGGGASDDHQQPQLFDASAEAA